MRTEAASGEMKLNVKTLKGTNFEIEASPDASVRPPFPVLLTPIRAIPCNSLRFRSIRVRLGAISRWSGAAIARPAGGSSGALI